MTSSETPAVTDRDQRLAYFDGSDEYTPYLATEAGDAVFLVKTEDKHIARSLFAKRGRGELVVLERAVAAVEGIFGRDAVARRTFIDVGANIGTTTVPAVLSHGFDSAVAIEPEPENFRVLRLNVLLNDLEDRVATLQLAASNEIGRSELAVTRSRGGKHWIVTDRSKLKRKKPETEIVTVETVTLDHLVETGAIDAERTGMVWMDAEAHEGHILEGAASLLDRGTPLVLEWNPVILDRVGDRGKLQRLVADSYTHFAGMGRNPQAGGASYPLQPLDQLAAYAERFLDPDDPSTKTDILVLRLTAEQAAGTTSLDDFLRPGPDPEADIQFRELRRSRLGALLRRLRRRR